jgi:carbon starvation protein CstA
MAAICVYLIAYRYYSLFIADKVLGLDATRNTPAWRHNDGLDYVPTNKYVLFGHHFAAIAGAGPLVGPVLAAQMGYLPGLLWILAGVVLAGAVQDFIVLFISTRRDGRSLGDLVKQEMGNVPGVIALFGAFMIMIIILAVLALIVVKALAIALGHLHRDGHHPGGAVHGLLRALHPPGPHRRGVGHRLRAADGGHRRRPGRVRKPGLGPAVHGKP